MKKSAFFEALSKSMSFWNQEYDLVGKAPFLTIHLAAFILVFYAGFTWTALAVCAVSYWIRMFGITAAYHRYFSHRSYKTHRWFQFALGWLGACAAQRGPLWWAGHHRHHHRFSDTAEDVHSPVKNGFWWSHWGWILSKKYNRIQYDNVRDLAKFPELRFIDRYYMLPPLFYAYMVYLVGLFIEFQMPWLETTVFQVMVWGFLISTVICYHFTFSINSVAHVFGRQRFKTRDESRNSLILALLTMGEGWHNNHHRYPSSEKQGFYWWEIDIAHYILTVFSWCGLVWDLRRPPRKIYEEAETAGSAPIEAKQPAAA